MVVYDKINRQRNESSGEKAETNSRLWEYKIKQFRTGRFLETEEYRQIGWFGEELSSGNGTGIVQLRNVKPLITGQVRL